MRHHPGDLSKLKTPTLCMVGEHDPYVTPESARKLAHMLPNSRFMELQNCDYMFHIEQPYAAIEAATEFLLERDDSVIAA